MEDDIGPLPVTFGLGSLQIYEPFLERDRKVVARPIGFVHFKDNNANITPRPRGHARLRSRAG